MRKGQFFSTNVNSIFKKNEDRHNNMNNDNTANSSNEIGTHKNLPSNNNDCVFLSCHIRVIE